MQIDLDRTQEWLNRTQAIRRTPAVRGGIVRDHRTIRQTVISILAALLFLLAIFLIPRSLPEQPNRIASAEILPVLTEFSTNTVLPPPQPFAPTPQSPAQLSYQQKTNVLDQPQVFRYRPATDRIAPHAPIWIVNQPVSWSPEAASGQVESSPQLPPSGISVLNR